MKEEKMILMDSPEAASIQTVTGWVSADGRWFGNDERTARYAGCTHRKCEECGSVITKNRVNCPTCAAARRRERFLAMPIVEWDGKTPLNLLGTDTYFFDEDDVLNYAEENETPLSELGLVLCVPHHPAPYDANDLFSDYLPDEGELQDKAVWKAVSALNDAIKNAEPFSWLPGNKRVVISEQTQAATVSK